ncbi:MAG: hypothetical protein GY851_20405 [bacterium]|nr:hypothetical protein [bacterium]
MQVIVDGDAGFAFTGDPPDVLAVVAAVSEALDARDRAILAIRVDGDDVRVDELVDSLQSKPLEEVGVLSVESGEIATLVREALADFEKVLPELPTVCRDLAAVFQSETPEDGFDPFNRLAEIWAHVKSREGMVMRVLGLEGDDFMVKDVTVAAHHDELNTHLREAIAALETNDCVLLGDLLEYELAPRAELETEVVSALQEKARERFG